MKGPELVSVFPPIQVFSPLGVLLNARRRIGYAVYLVLIDELGILEKNAHSVMTDAKNWRRQWHYEAREPPEPLVERFVSLAEQFHELAVASA